MIRDAPNVTGPITYVELAGGDIDRERLAERRARGTITMGRALLAGLLEACLDAGVQIRAGVRVRERPSEDAVVIATGGFERDGQLVQAFLRGPMLAPVGAPSARGDGLRLAIAEGALLGNMSEAWWCPAITIPGETIDGVPMNRLILTERARPHSLLVDATGRRFVNEAQNYNDLGRTLQNFDPGSYSFPHVPAWLIFDAAYRALVPARPARPARSRSGVAGQGRHARRAGGPGRRSRPPRWRRPSRASTRARGAGRTRTSAAARTRTTASSAASGRSRRARTTRCRVVPGCLSTKGGPRTDGDGRVRSIAGNGGVDRRPLRGRQLRRERVRHGLPRRRRHARAGPHVRLPSGRRGRRGLMLNVCRSSSTTSRARSAGRTPRRSSGRTSA